MGVNDGAGQIQTHLFFEQDLLEDASFDLAGGVVAIYSMRCPGKETPNEDSVAIIPTGGESGVLAIKLPSELQLDRIAHGVLRPIITKVVVFERSER